MGYTFEIVAVSPILNFFNQQQRVESTPHRSRAYVGSYHCTLDSFIAATEQIHERPDWDWDAVVQEMVDFWMNHGDRVSQWRQALAQAEETSLIVGRVANFSSLRGELEHLFRH